MSMTNCNKQHANDQLKTKTLWWSLTTKNHANKHLKSTTLTISYNKQHY